MDWHSRRDSPGYGTQENDAANPPGMESCLKKLGLDADRTVLGDPERDARSRWSSRRKNCTRWDADGCIFSIAGRPKRKFRLEVTTGHQVPALAMIFSIRSRRLVSIGSKAMAEPKPG